MFLLDGITLRPLEPADIPLLYPWHQDYELDMFTSWAPRQSLEQFVKRYEERILEPDEDVITFGIQFEGRLVGRISLELIDRDHRRASVGLVIGDRSVWGRGVGRTALRIMVDFAFTLENLERVYAEVYGFNLRSLRLMTTVGFQQEGVLRGHEVQLGVRQDLLVFGLLREEFYERYPTIFPVPRSEY